MWTSSIPASCSWFYRGLCRNANHIKPFLWMSNINPANTSFPYDPWYFDIPLAFKPTFLNMDMDLKSIQLFNLLLDTHWNIHLLRNLFGLILNEFSISHGNITHDLDNTWVWFPIPHWTKVSTMVYSYFSQQVTKQDSWDGWSIIWHLKVTPHVKHFIWLLLHNSNKTHEYLYRLKLGLQAMCGFYNLFIETVEHLLHTYPNLNLSGI